MRLIREEIVMQLFTEGWRITLIVPGRPRLIGYTTGRE
jgi:hypothetical protein